MAKNPEVQDVENRFAFHPATEVTGPQHDAVRADLKRLALKFVKTLPPGRHKSMALTHLQEAMWAANAAIACDTPAAPEAPAEAKPAAKKTAAKKTAEPAKPRRRVTREPAS